ncbi:RHS repeat-associated core domain-containing protein [Promicromonospora kroppenstedtii]|uniref:RHS repeat-associated core domain-containing protein n=1 Tax=Promicromonospora kroppenstedtii TaxID=440482 RepID=UPI0004AD66B6|nr:RHS repeat-associated core domain-containing protein [Promicromonospora kroppenstedtii]
MRRLTTVIAGIAVVGVIFSTTAGPAAAAVLTSLAERESWTLEERVAHGEDLWGKDAVKGDEPLPAYERKAMPAGEPPAIVEGAPTTDSGDDSDAPAAPTEPGQVTLTPRADKAVRGEAGGLPVAITLPEPPGAHRADADAGQGAPASLRVRTLNEAAAERAGITGVLLTVTGDTAEDAGSRGRSSVVDLAVDTSELGFSPDWISRARLVQLPACVLTTPGADACDEASELPEALDASSGDLVSARIELPTATPTTTDAAGRQVADSEPMVLALMADTSGDQGDWSATPLDPSATWDVTGNTGAFTWSYPMRTPPVPGGLAPEVSLNYDSGSLDGKVASTNSQAGEIGDGWSLSTGGYIERSYVPCDEDTSGSANNASHRTGDLCWKSDNASLVLGGKAGELIKDGSTDTFRLAGDDNTKVERFRGTNTSTPGWNGDNDKEWWKVTTSDGTQYFFGRDRIGASDGMQTYSTWPVRIFGNHPGEPCYNASFASAGCNQAWRWNLEYVLDTSGNTMTYLYEREWNSYEPDDGAAAPVDYVSGGTLTRVLYGTRQGGETATSPARVEFVKSERCLVTSDFDCAAAKIKDNPERWPDVPEDLMCSVDATECANQYTPSFFSRKRVTAVSAQIYTAGAWMTVDKWNLKHTFPDPGGETGKQLWLESIDHDGLAADASADDVIDLPFVSFTGSGAPNRVDTQLDGRPSMHRFRLTQILAESGGTTNVTYSAPDCTASSKPASPWSNTRLCMPVNWTPAGSETEVLEYFHKYVVTATLENARIAGSRNVETYYTYEGAPAWHYDDNELVRPKLRTWGQWRGYGAVETRVGETGISDHPQLRTRTSYFRGMHGDRLNADGGTRDIQVDGINDLDQYAGMERETTTYNGTAVVERDLSTPWRSGATATDARGKSAYHTGIQKSETITTAPDLTAGTRTVVTDTEFDAYGLPEKVIERGDTAKTGDETCTRTTYVRNTDKNILETVQRAHTTVGESCPETGVVATDVVADNRYAYDGGAVGAAPTRGLVTTTQEVKAYSSGSPSYVNVERTTYDAFGRPLTSTDALGRVTTTEYTETGGLQTRTTVKSPDPDGSGSLTQHVTVTDLDPAFGVPTKVTDPNGNVTSGKYDGLGRLVSVWEPGRVQGTDTANTTFAYTVRDTGINAVTTKTLNHDASAYLTSTTILDGLLRDRQTQSPSADRDNPGRVVTDTLYDTRGLAHITYDRWFVTGTPGTTVVFPTTGAGDDDDDFKFVVPSSTVTQFDGAGRPTAAIERSGADERWRTTTSYRGDRTLVDPPTGGTPSMEITDARGNVVELHQYLGASPSGTSQVTKYTYDLADRLTKVTDPATNNWSYTYDLRGRQLTASDPDKGTSSTTYDDAGQVITTTDARNEKLFNVYDALGRKTETRDDTVTGALRSSWAYDTLAKGALTSSTRHSGGVALTTSVTGYDHHYRPSGQTVTVPTNSTLPAGLTGSYTIEYTYTATGLPKTTYLPRAGGINGETVTTTYDSANQPVQMIGGAQGSYVNESEYSEYGDLLFADIGGNFSVGARWTYDVNTRRLTEQSVTREGAGGDDVVARYTYDDAGNVLGIKNNPTATGATADRQCFDYDGLRRLTNAWTPSNGDCATSNRTVAGLGGADPYWTSYTYDAVGNRKSVMQHATTANGGDQTSTYAYPAAGGAAGTKPHAVTGVTTKNASGVTTGTSSFTYDATGNMTGRNLAGQSAQTLAWDAEGELTSVAQDGNGDGDAADANETDKYLYSADGERLVRSQDGASTLYLPGGIELTAYADGRASTANRYYTFNGKTITTRASVGAAGQTTMIPDHHGTPMLQVNQTTNAITREYTDPFGATRGSVVGDADADGRLDGTNPAWVGDRGYLDKPEDASGLTAIGARMYDPVLGRFISVDPVMDLSDPQQWNAYSYANNMPVTLSDPTGEKPYAHDGSSGGYKPPIQEALPKDRSVKSGRGVARSAPKAGQPGTYVPERAPSTSYRGGYYSGGGGKTAAKGSGPALKPIVPEPLNLKASTFANTADLTMTAMDSADSAVSAYAARPGGAAGVQMSGGGYLPQFAGVGRYVPYVGVGLTVAADVQQGGGLTGKTGAYLAVDGGAILAGMAAGALTGMAIGTIVPGAGNVVGGVLGALIAVTPVLAAAGTTLWLSNMGHKHVDSRRWD